jgi:hypothetical protein
MSGSLRSQGRWRRAWGWIGLSVALCLRPGPASGQPPPSPVAVTVELSINKIFDIDTRNETFGLDAYLRAAWQDTDLGTIDDCPLRLHGRRAREFLDQRWWPAFELINSVGARTVSQSEVKMDCSGRTVYTERFTATLNSELDLARFPFDEQTFHVVMESFHHRVEELVFVSPLIDIDRFANQELPEWRLVGTGTRVTTQRYTFREKGGTDAKILFSRLEMELQVARRSRYYVWHFLLPLALILAASWTAFLLTRFEHQLSTVLRLLLTLIAFSFTTSSLLPKLHYTTFINRLIIAGHVVIFAEVVLVALAHGLCLAGRKSWSRRILATCRWSVPLACLLAVVWLILRLHAGVENAGATEVMTLPISDRSPTHSSVVSDPSWTPADGGPPRPDRRGDDRGSRESPAPSDPSPCARAGWPRSARTGNRGTRRAPRR